MALPALAIVAMVTASAVAQPWLAYLVIAGLYIVLMPLSLFAYLRRRARYLKDNG